MTRLTHRRPGEDALPMTTLLLLIAATWCLRCLLLAFLEWLGS
jgi:hypothetical protein